MKIGLTTAVHQPISNTPTSNISSEIQRSDRISKSGENPFTGIPCVLLRGYFMLLLAVSLWKSSQYLLSASAFVKRYSNDEGRFLSGTLLIRMIEISIWLWRVLEEKHRRSKVAEFMII
ncbi:hypothetical protein AVEN_222735-1 [Araneus ventricosus]|uniref:Uncharacterized protein n=1 Tax=Araneus ventricosus TaxID=182803 RepID=A0A4Y2B1F3_ARAVE|nr:hypothetical protein AVEN_222735-1 [Araneus ventricosus]